MTNRPEPPYPALPRWSFLVMALVLAGKSYYFNASIGLYFDSPLEGVVSLVPLYLVFSTVLTLAFPRHHLRLGGLLSFLATFIVQLDLLYYRYFSDLPSVTLLPQFTNLRVLGDSTSGLFHLPDLLLYLDLPLWWMCMKAPGHFKPVFKELSVMLVLALGLLSTENSLATPVAIIFERNYPAGYLLHFGVFPFHLQDIYRTLRSLSPPPPLQPQEEALLATYVAGLSPRHNPYTRKFAGKNLLVIQVESLQGFVIGRTLNGRPITPFLNRLAGESLYFPNFYHQTARGRTSDAEFLVQNALYPLKNRITYWALRLNNFYGLPKALDALGYHTLSLHANISTYYNRRHMHHYLGFRNTYFKDDFMPEDRIGWGLSDKSFLRQARQRLDKVQSPYYAFLITLTSHYPYDGRYPTRTPLALGDLQGTLLGNYFQALHYTDEAIGDFVEGLRARGGLKDTVVAIYGDHIGIPIDNQNDLQRFLGIYLDDVAWLKLQTVPLFLLLPDGEHSVVPKYGGQVDVAPTLANLLGVGDILFPGLGRDLLDRPTHPVIFRNGAWLDGWAICTDSRCYDYRTGQPVSSIQVAGRVNRVKVELAVSDLLNHRDLIPRVRREIRAHLRVPRRPPVG